MKYFKGGGGSSAPTETTVTQTDLPEYVQPYFERLLKRGEAESNQPYSTYGGERIAYFSPDELTSQAMTRGYAQAGTPYEYQLASQRASASIGTQEAQNERLRAQEAGRLQQLEAGEASRLQTMSAEEQAALNMAEAQMAGNLQMSEAQQAQALQMAAAQGGTQLQMAQAGDLASLQMAAAQQGNQLQLAQAEGATNLQMAQAGFGGQALMAEAGAGMDIQSQIAQGAQFQQQLQADIMGQLMNNSIQQAQLQISAAAAGDEQPGLFDVLGSVGGALTGLGIL